MEDPIALLRRLKLGREEYCQRLLTMLILGSGYPRWNTRLPPSPAGFRWLRDVDVLCFGESRLPASVDFVDEFELPPRHDGERGGAPDYAVLAPGRLWLIELKTEVASHRRDQIPYYFDLGRHRHPAKALDITYVTPPFALSGLDVPDGSRFSHVSWDEVVSLAERQWSGSEGLPARLLDAFKLALEGIGSPWSGWRTARLRDPVASGLDLARLTEADGRQRALDYTFTSLEDLQAARFQLREALLDAHSNVRPWVWQRATSGGHPLTALGEQVGYELRLSRYVAPDIAPRG